MNDVDHRSKFKEIFEANYRALCFFAFQLLGDKELAKDTVQDAFAAYWKQSATLENNEKIIKSYLYSAVKFKALKNYRHKMVVERYSASLSVSLVDNADITEKIIRSEVINELYKALDLLPESCREIFRLGYMEGLSNPKIAEVLNISVNTVKTQKQRGIKILRNVLKPEAIFLLLLTCQ